MNKWRQQLGKVGLIKRFSSIRITVTCLALLFILTFWGTIAQMEQGLYAAQERFFFSWGFLAGGFFPFPGAKLVLWVLFINLVSVAITRFVFDRNHVGIIIIHMGLLTYFIAAFVVYTLTVESQVTLLEGEGTNVAQDYRQWELSFWTDEGEKRKVTAVDASAFKIGTAVALADLGLTVTAQEYHQNAQAYLAVDKNDPQLSNNSGIGSLVKVKADIESEKNLPGGIFEIRGKRSATVVLLYGGESAANTILINEKTYNVQLRRQRYELPFVIRLNDFQMDVHPGTEIARSYKSQVTLFHDGLSREVLIWMNHPLRFKDYTLYQASYSIDRFGRERSTLAVVKNAGWMLPYLASGITFMGLLTHFLMMAFKSRKPRA